MVLGYVQAAVYPTEIDYGQCARTMQETSRNIFVVNFDWRDLFRTGRDEYYKKLERDQLCPDLNSFFFFSWAHVAYRDAQGTWRTEHVRTHGLHRLRPLLNLWALVRVPYSAWRNKVRPDVWLVYDFGMVPACAVARRLFGGRVIMLLTNQPRALYRTRRFGMVRVWYAYVAEYIGVQFVDHFFTLNESMRAYLGDMGVASDRTSIYTVNTIERDKDLIAASKAGCIRARYNLPAEKKLLLTVARLEPEKNHTQLFDLFAALPDEYVLFCLGEGSMRTQLEKQLVRLGLADRVYLVGNVEREEIWDYYRDADAFMLLSRSEALGIVFWEAMYMSVPVIGSAIPGIMESLGNDGERGRIWHTEDGAAGLEERVAFCTEPSEARDAMLNRAQAYVTEQLANKKTLNMYLDTVQRNETAHA